MLVPILIGQVLRLAPKCLPEYQQAFDGAQDALEHFRIADSALRLSHFMGQILHESDALTRQYENLNYKAARLVQVWPQRFLPLGPLDPADYAHNERKLANAVYGGRLGNTSPEDGFTYRGRGLLQLTGKDSYARATLHLQRSVPTAPDFVCAPDAVLDPAWSILVAAAEWFEIGCNELADQDDLEQITRRINGGLIGLAGRAHWVRKAGKIWLSPIIASAH
jgi:putative chitinase